MLNIFLFISAFGLLLLNNNLILFIIAMEIFLLAINISYIEYSLLLNEPLGLIISIIILIMAAIETSLGLSLLVVI